MLAIDTHFLVEKVCFCSVFYESSGFIAYSVLMMEICNRAE